MPDDLYADPEVCQAILMDYYRNPRCAGTCTAATHNGEGENPACGDVVRISLQITPGAGTEPNSDGGANPRITEARTTGAGCAISQASASLLMERIEGQSVTEAKAVIFAMHSLLTGNPKSEADSEYTPKILQHLESLKMIRHNPARVRCAMIAPETAARLLEFTLPPAAGSQEAP